MGGASGGGLSNFDIKILEEKIKQRLAKAQQDIRHVFISFDHQDLDEVNLLRGQAKNDKSDLEFDDYSVKIPFNSDNADYIKSKIREKLDLCSVTLVYLTDKTLTSEWVNWEIEESLKRHKGVIGVYKGKNPPPKIPDILNKNGCKIIKWEHTALSNAISDASINRFSN